MIRLQREKGFTLIELLVVIAIIGLLASVVLVSVNSARSKGADAVIKSDLRNAVAQAELLYDDASPNSYANICVDPIIIDQMKHAANAAGNAYTLGLLADAQVNTSPTKVVVCHATAIAYMIQAYLKSTTTASWCVDSTGASRQVGASALLNATVCL